MFLLAVVSVAVFTTRAFVLSFGLFNFFIDQTLFDVFAYVVPELLPPAVIFWTYLGSKARKRDKAMLETLTVELRSG
jgi:magnesium-transporting ATPase (P-type)